jgi:hypothetical protein
MSSQSQFYVGYLPLPKSWKSTIILFAALWLIGLAVFGVVLAANQDAVQPGVWDTSTVREVEGVLHVDPYPVLYLDDEETGVPHKGVLLVAENKFGVGQYALPFAGQRVRVQGHFVGQQSRAMYELLDGADSFSTVSKDVAQFKSRDLGQHTLAGEIVDSKCFLGVMKPGYGKTHRACAVRCLSGGITPIFVTRAGDGEATIYVMTDAQNQPINEFVLPYVAEPVAITGQVYARGDLLYFAIDPASLKRL